MSTIAQDLMPTQWLERFQNAAKTRMDIVSGQHAGANAVLDAGTYVVGRATDADIVLFAEQAADIHCRIELPSMPFGARTITAVDGPVVFNGETLEPGEVRQTDDDFTLEIGAAQIEFSSLINIRNTLNLVITAVIAVIAIIILIIGLNTAGRVFTAAAGAASAAKDQITSGVSAASRWTASAPAADEPITDGPRRSAAQAIAPVRAKIAELQLQAFVRAQPTADNGIQITGTIPPTKGQAWNAFLRWYDTNTKFPQLVREVVRAETPPDIPVLQAVFMNGVPTAYFGDGSAARVGDTLPGNWEVVRIAKTGVVLQRDGLPVNLTF